MPTVWHTDTTRWPIALVFLEGPDDGTPPDENSLEQACESLLSRGERHGVLLDLTGSRPNRDRRRLIVEWGRTNMDRMRRHTLAVALVAPSAPLRGIVTALKWLLTAPFAYDVFATRAEASAWLADELRAAGIEVDEY